MGNEQAKGGGSGEGAGLLERVTYFAINIKQPDKLHIVPADKAV